MLYSVAEKFISCGMDGLENLISQQLQCLSGLTFYTHLDGAFLEPKISLTLSATFYLGVKWISLKHVMALELPCVSLDHCQVVLIPLKYLGLVNFFETTSREVSLLDD